MQESRLGGSRAYINTASLPNTALKRDFPCTREDGDKQLLHPGKDEETKSHTGSAQGEQRASDTGNHCPAGRGTHTAPAGIENKGTQPSQTATRVNKV